MEERALVLTLNERDSLSYLAALKELYREEGIWTIYSLPPVIFLNSYNYDEEVDIGDGKFTFGPELIRVNEGYYLTCADSKGLPILGLYAARQPFKKKIEVTVGVKALAILSYDELTYSILRSRPLRRHNSQREGK